MIPLASVSWEAASESDSTPDQNNGLFCPLTQAQRAVARKRHRQLDRGVAERGLGARAAGRAPQALTSADQRCRRGMP